MNLQISYTYMYCPNYLLSLNLLHPLNLLLQMTPIQNSITLSSLLSGTYLYISKLPLEVPSCILLGNPVGANSLET